MPIVVGAVVVAAALALWLAPQPDEEVAPTVSESAAPETPPEPSPPVPTSPPAPAGVYDPDRVMKSGGTWIIAVATVPTDRPVVLNLEVPAPPAGTEFLGVRLLAEGREPFEAPAAIVGEARDRARVEVPPGWLAAGRVVVEVKTTEKTHFPLRRYALEIR